MHDLRWLRQHGDEFDAAMARRGVTPVAAKILGQDRERREVETSLQAMQTERNRASKEIGDAKRQGDEARAATMMQTVANLKDGMKTAEDRLRDLDQGLADLLAALPNILEDDVPEGADETANVEIRRHGEPRTLSFEAQHHADIGRALGLDMERAAKLAGARFGVLFGDLARLQRGLARFMLDLQTREHGYTEVYVPYLVRDEAVFGTGQLPKFGDDLFRTTNGMWLVPTAEVPLTNLYREEILADADLPIRLTALTPCFRSEAGSAGRDVKGLLRVHQFEKVELVSVCHPDRSQDEHERMTGCAEEVLKRLGLPYRVVTLCAGDTGFTARKTYDIEVWLPSYGTYREISSCSNCGDFQARRMNTRFREPDGSGTRFVHTLNGSGIAVGRALIAVIENYQEKDGSVRLPEVLHDYCGMEVLHPRVER